MGNKQQKPLVMPPVAINRPVVSPAGRLPAPGRAGPVPVPVYMQQSQLFIQPQPIIYHQPIIPAPSAPACLPASAPCGPPAIAFGGFGQPAPALAGPGPCGPPPAIAFSGFGQPGPALAGPPPIGFAGFAGFGQPGPIGF